MKYLCSQCHLVLNELDIKPHISAKHLSYFPFECISCKEANQKYSAVMKKDMDLHMSTQHNGNNLDPAGISRFNSTRDQEERMAASTSNLANKSASGLLRQTSRGEPSNVMETSATAERQQANSSRQRLNEPPILFEDDDFTVFAPRVSIQAFGNGGMHFFGSGGSNGIFNNSMVFSGCTVINGNIVGGSYAEVLYSTKFFAKKSIEHVVSNTMGGNISITGGNAEDKVEVYVAYNNGFTLSKEQIQARLKKHYDLEVWMKDGTLTTSAHQKSVCLDWQQQLNIGFKVYVHQKVSTHLHTVGGNITLKNLSGSQDFKTSGGKLTVDRVTGQIRGSTSGGNINLSNSKDDIDMSTSGGNVNANDCSGRLCLRTSGGNIRLDRLYGTIKACTSGGNVRADTITGSLSAQTSGGNLALDKISGTLNASNIAGRLSASMTKITGSTNVTNFHGDVDLKLPSSGKFNLNATGNRVSTSGFGSDFGNISTTSARGKINGGGASVTVNGSRVNINIV